MKHVKILQNYFYLKLLALFTIKIFISPLVGHKQKIGLKIEILIDIIVSLEQTMVMEVERVVVKMEEVVL